MVDDRIRITVVIPTRNRAETLEKCLAAFRAQTLDPDRFEVVVVDDGSTDGTGELLNTIAGGMGNLGHLSQEPGGPAKARNMGIREAKYPLILLTGDDCIPSATLLEKHLAAHRESPRVAVLGHIAWHPDLEVTPFMEYVGRSHQFSFPIIAQERLSVPFGFFYTSNISVGKELLLRAGLFDEEFTDAVWEDAEMGYRLAKSGVRIVYDRRAVTFHYHPVTLSQYIDRQIRAGKAAAVFYRKHPECSDMLRMEDSVSPEIRENFYDTALKYYYAVGVQAGLAELNGKGFDMAGFRVPLEDTLESWSGRISARLLRHLRHETEHVMRLWRERDSVAEERNRLAEKRDRLVEELHLSRERADAIEEKNRSLARELELHRVFAEKVKKSLPYRIYNALKALRGGKG
ncbi:MAG: glycosyltransferase [Chlamydiota bacterium]